MATAKVPDHKTADQQESILSPMEKTRKDKYGTMGYVPEFADIAYKILSSKDNAATKAHVCAALHCAKDTLLAWMKKYPEFNKAIVEGLKIGEKNWREKIRQHAFQPTKNVNNGLIKLLSSNVYGIKDDPTAIVNIHNENNMDAEQMLKNRGIPIPTIKNEDVDESMEDESTDED